MNKKNIKDINTNSYPLSLTSNCREMSPFIKRPVKPSWNKGSVKITFISTWLNWSFYARLPLTSTHCIILLKNHVQDPVSDPVSFLAQEIWPSLVQEKLHVQYKKLRHEIIQENTEDHITIKQPSREPVRAHGRPAWLPGTLKELSREPVRAHGRPAWLPGIMNGNLWRIQHSFPRIGSSYCFILSTTISSLSLLLLP